MATGSEGTLVSVELPGAEGDRQIHRFCIQQVPERNDEDPGERAPCEEEHGVAGEVCHVPTASALYSVSGPGRITLLSGVFTHRPFTVPVPAAATVVAAGPVAPSGRAPGRPASSKACRPSWR
jgi:hypothetical protein